MQVIDKKAQLRAELRNFRVQGRTNGFVPTMGYLHEGHLALVRRARRENDRVIVSIFVNPTQFGPNEDLEAYPRDTARDMKLLGDEQVDVVFVPSVAELYPERYTTFVEVEGPMTQVLCGSSRPTHFRGVTTIVAKFLHLVQPERAYFGQKDAQQLAVIRQMVRDLDFDVEIVACPTVRESDGLAMSSRNTYLSQRERAQAPLIFRALNDAREIIEDGERRAAVVIERIKKTLDGIDSATLDYVSIVDAKSLTALENLNGPVLIAVAVKLGRTRLIDNIIVDLY